MRYSLLLITLILLCSFVYATGIQLDEFSNGLDEENLTITINNPTTRYFLIPSYAQISNVSMSLKFFNLTHTPQYYCHQNDEETPNLCGATGISEKRASGSWLAGHLAPDMMDEDLTSWAEANGDSYYYVNWTKPSGNITNVILQISDQRYVINASYNHTLFDNCTNRTDNKVYMRFYAGTSGGERLQYDCYDETDTPQQLYSDYGVLHGKIYEVNMLWQTNYSNTSYGPSINVGNYSSWFVDGQYNLNTNLSLNITHFNAAINDNCNCGTYGCYINDSYCYIPLQFSLNSTAVINYYDLYVNYTAAIGNCTDYDKPILNFSIYDENALTLLTANVSGTIEFAGYNYTFNYYDVNKFSVCADVGSYSDSIDAYIQFKQAVQERYYIENYKINASVTRLVNMYNFDDDTGLSELNAITYNYYYAPYVGLIGKLQRFYAGENVWRTVQIDKTDDDGQLLFWIYQNTHDYKIIWEEDGAELDRTTSLKFICDTATECEDSFVVEEADDADNYLGMGYSGVFNNNTGIYTFTWTDSNSLVSSVKLLVQKPVHDGYIDICDSTLSSSSGSIVCNVSGYDGIIQVRAIRTASPDDPFYYEVLEIVSNTLAQVLSGEGLSSTGNFLSLLIAIVFVGFGAATGSALLVVIFGIFSSIIIYLLHIGTFLTYVLLTTIIGVGIIVAYILKR